MSAYRMKRKKVFIYFRLWESFRKSFKNLRRNISAVFWAGSKALKLENFQRKNGCEVDLCAARKQWCCVCQSGGSLVDSAKETFEAEKKI